MKRWLGFAIVVLLGVAALVMGERRKAEAPVSPDPVVYFIADTEREMSRVVATATRLSDEEEIRIGDELAAQYAGGSTALTGDDAAVEAYVQKVGLQVGARAHRQLPYKFHYIPDRGFVNAFALPGGHVYIGAGLLALMDSEDQLAGVLGHEVEHIDHYHCAERVQLEARLRRLNLGVVGALLQIPVEVFQAGYTKDQELEADSEGTRLAARTGYAPEGTVRLFERFAKLERESSQPARTPQEEAARAALQTLQGYFRSHPPAAERIAHLRRTLPPELWNRTSERPLAVAQYFPQAASR
jgi:predicted Zn-dependent protease